MIENRYISLKNNRNMKIALLSDIHYSKEITDEFLDTIYDNILKNNPDYITIIGDLLDESINGDNNLLSWLEKLAGIAPIIISLGNHDIVKKEGLKRVFAPDYNYFDKISKIKNVSVVNNLSKEFDDIIFHGYTEIYNEQKKRVVYTSNEFNRNFKVDNYLFIPEKINVFLGHSPESFICKDGQLIDNEFIKKMDLVLCGHMHDGMVIRQKKSDSKHRGLVGPYLKFRPKNSRGIFKYDKTTLIISGGLTKISNVNIAAVKLFRPLYKSHLEYISFEK